MNYPSYNQTSVNNSKFSDEISSVHSCIKYIGRVKKATGGMCRESFRLANHVRSSNGWGQSTDLKVDWIVHLCVKLKPEVVAAVILEVPTLL